MKPEIIIFGIGSLAKFLVQELSDSFNLTGLSRSFSCEVNTEVIYKAGDKIDKGVSESPQAIIINFPPSPELINTLEIVNDYFSMETPVIFVSSTSVYSSGTVSEGTPLNKQSRLYPCEHLIAGWPRPVTVVRPGGLFDKTRNPANFFKNRNEVQGESLPVNMVHSLDVALFIKHIIKNKIFNEAYNLVATAHPTKKEFYGLAIQLKGYEQPAWVKSKAEPKCVQNDKSRSTGFTYKYDDLLSALKLINSN